MDRAMERDLSVNVSTGSDPHRPDNDLKAAINRLLSAGAPPQAPQDDQGPCLYLGPGGQRCGRPALAGGFCVAHSPQGQGPKDRTANPARFWAAAGAIAALLWPYLEFVVREIIRWARSH